MKTLAGQEGFTGGKYPNIFKTIKRLTMALKNYIYGVRSYDSS